MKVINQATLDELPLSKINAVTFYKRDEVTTDLICCDVDLDDRTWFFHEGVPGWDLLLAHLEMLPDFQRNWLAAVSQPPFSACQTIAYRRS